MRHERRVAIHGGTTQASGDATRIDVPDALWWPSTTDSTVEGATPEPGTGLMPGALWLLSTTDSTVEGTTPEPRTGLMPGALWLLWTTEPETGGKSGPMTGRNLVVREAKESAVQ